MVNGCLEGSKWCTVTHNGAEGWVYSDYLTADVSGSAVVLTEGYADVGVPVGTYEDSGVGEGAAAGAATGAVAGALIAGSIGAAVGVAAGAAAGGTAGAVIDPPAEVRTYVTSNPVDPAYLEGEVVVGAGLPATVELREVPNYEHRYVYVDGQPVLVESRAAARSFTLFASSAPLVQARSVCTSCASHSSPVSLCLVC